MTVTPQIITKLKSREISVETAEYKACGYHYEVKLSASQVRDFAQIMLEDEFYLDFVSAVHVTPSFQIVYQFAKFEEPCRINAKAIANPEGDIPTIADIFHGANWHERETHDFYGVKFTGHPDLRTLILSEEDADLKPLLKGAKLVDLDGITRKAGDAEEKKPAKPKKEEKSPE
jgi:NADH-quinone oxidoreductase subunit C